MSSWVVALEVGQDPDGPTLDVRTLARRIEAVGEIRPDGPGTRRHALLVCLECAEAADALSAAIARFREAALRGGSLLAARVIRPGGQGAEVHPGRDRALTPARLATVATALLVAVLVVAAVTRLGSLGSSGHADNLLANSSFEMAAPKGTGAAKGLTPWGATGLALVESPVHSGTRAQLVRVAPGQMGGAWFEVAAVPATAYRQSLWLDVTELASGSRVEMVLEWYGSGSKLLGYQTLALSAIDSGLVLRSQTATSPPGTQKVRFLVNFTHGGGLVMDSAGLVVVPPAASPRGSAPQPAR